MQVCSIVLLDCTLAPLGTGVSGLRSLNYDLAHFEIPKCGVRREKIRTEQLINIDLKTSHRAHQASSTVCSKGAIYTINPSWLIILPVIDNDYLTDYISVAQFLTSKDRIAKGRLGTQESPTGSWIAARIHKAATHYRHSVQ